MKRFAFIFGTRPEIIKMAPFIHEAQRRRVNFFIIHTGQHYSEIMDKIFWKDLELPEAQYHLGVGSGTHAEQVGKMMMGVESVLLQEKPEYVCVYADCNSSIAGAIAAAKLNIKVIQLEAGLRSFDRTMPEEINRIVADRLSNYHFAPTSLQREHLASEGINENVFVVGNLISDAVIANLSKAVSRSTIFSKLGIAPLHYFLATIHRAGGVDSPENFSNLLQGLNLVARHFNLPVIYPIHPRSRKNLALFGLTAGENVRLIDPIDYFDFLTLMHGARIILSDSGGIQEEASIMRVPLVTLRENTERQETLVLGSNILSGFIPAIILEKVKEMDARPRTWQHPYGENVAQKMWDMLTEKLSLQKGLNLSEYNISQPNSSHNF